MSLESGKKLVALRHTAVATTAGLCYGQIDVPLATSYAEDLNLVKQRLRAPGFSRVISSPLKRCHRLAIDLECGPVTRDPRIQELSFGQWEGQLWSEIPREISEYWTDDVIHRSPPGGESFVNLVERVATVIRDPELWQDSESVLLVTHAGVIRALIHLLEGREYAECLKENISFGEYRAWDFSGPLRTRGP